MDKRTDQQVPPNFSEIRLSSHVDCHSWLRFSQSLCRGNLLLCVAVRQRSHRQIFTQLTKARFPEQTLGRLSKTFAVGFLSEIYDTHPYFLESKFASMTFESKSSKSRKSIKLFGFTGVQFEVCWFDLYRAQPTSLWLSDHQRLLSGHTICQGTRWALRLRHFEQKDTLSKNLE